MNSVAIAMLLKTGCVMAQKPKFSVPNKNSRGVRYICRHFDSMEKLKERWGISSNFQLIVIFIVFAITGSSSVYVAKPFLEWIGMNRDAFSGAWWGGFIYWTLRILLIFPFYQILLVIYGWLFGQFKFFWGFEKKMLSRMGLGFFFK